MILRLAGDGRLWSARLLIAGGLVGLMLLGLGAVRMWPETVLLNAANAMDHLRGMGVGGLVLFAVLQAVVALSGVLPASLLGVAAGALYGLVPGFLLASASTIAGAVLAFLLSRSLFRGAIERMLRRRPRIQGFDAMIARDGWKFVCLLRISPIMPFAATSYLLGMSSLGMRDYVLGTLASLPALFGYVFIGTLADAGLSAWANGAGPLRWILLAIGIAATLLLTLRLGRMVVRLGRLAAPSTAAGADGG